MSTEKAPARRNATISLSQHTLDLADRRAAEEGRTRSNYLAWLVEQDVKRSAETRAERERVMVGA